MPHKTIETEGSTLIVSDDKTAEELNPASLFDKAPASMSVVGEPREFGEVKTGFDAALKGRILQRYENIRESNTQFSCEIIFEKKHKKHQQEKAETIEGILYSLKCEDNSKLVGFFADLHDTLRVVELFADGDYGVKIRNALVQTPKKEYKLEKVETINYLELREIINGTALVMISFI